MAHALSPSARRILAYCSEKGGLAPGDKVKAYPSTLEAMVRRGYLVKDRDLYLLTEEGRAALPWPIEGVRNVKIRRYGEVPPPGNGK